MMTDEQCKQAATDLVNAMKNNTNGAYDKWVAHTGLGDVAGRAKFVQETLGLPQTPTPEDLAAMQQHAQNALTADISQVQAKVSRANVVGEMCLAED
jgi:hypothetical protein